MTDQSHTPLLPCPFCGERALFTNRRGDKTKPPAWGIVCDGDCGMFSPDDDETQEDAARVWNTRSVNSLPSLVKALEEARQWVEANTAQVRGLSAQAAEPGETMLRKIDAALSAYRGEGK